MSKVSPCKQSIYFLLPMLLLLSACTSKPREVYASIPLVSSNEAKPSKKEIPEQFKEDLIEPSTTVLNHDKYEINLSELYISAMGYPCRELVITEDKAEPKRRIACEIPYKDENDKLVKSWFLEKAIIESSSYVDL